MAAAQSTEAFRDAFRAQIPPGYSGIRHGGSMLAFGLTVIAAALSGLSTPVSVWELAILVPVIVGWNFLEWHGHRALHRPALHELANMEDLGQTGVLVTAQGGVEHMAGNERGVGLGVAQASERRHRQALRLVAAQMNAGVGEGCRGIGHGLAKSSAEKE